MKKILSILLVATMIISACAFSASAADAVVYVQDGGTGDGTSAASPLGSLEEAYKVVREGGTIYLTGDITPPANNFNIEESFKGMFVAPATTNTVTIKSADPANKAQFIFSNDGCAQYLIQGDTVFDDLILVGRGGSTDDHFIGCGHHITMGAGIETAGVDPEASGYPGSTRICIYSIGRKGHMDYVKGGDHMAASGWVTIYAGAYRSIYVNYVNIEEEGTKTANSYLEILGDCLIGDFGLTNKTFPDHTGTFYVTLKGVVTMPGNFTFAAGVSNTPLPNLKSVVLSDGGRILDKAGADKPTNKLSNHINLSVYFNKDNDNSIAFSDFWKTQVAPEGSTWVIEDMAALTAAMVPADWAPNVLPAETEPPVTEAPETDPPETEAPETDAPETDAPAAEGGCGSFVGVSAASLLLALSLSVVLTKKKED